LKQWVARLIEQLDLDVKQKGNGSQPKVEMSEDRATLLYIIDTYNKNLLEIDTHPVRRVREILDEFSKELVDPGSNANTDKVLFRLRQFFSHYRVDEYTYIRKTFEDFKGILWDFVDQLSEDIVAERKDDNDVKVSLEELKEAVESDSIHELKAKAREFIDFYLESSTRREVSRERRMHGIKKNLDFMKKQLNDANQNMRLDHLTQAFNRKSFDERAKQQQQLFTLSGNQVSMIIMDIDFFKKINDTYGHDIGDFCLKECVRMLKECFHRDNDFVARIGGEEFAIILPDYAVPHAVKKADEFMAKVRKEVFITEQHRVQFTVSMGIAQLLRGESVDQWMKRADSALYLSKNSGRDRYTIASDEIKEAA
jgi:diguanylate cyclase